jgi:AcrR family transcriptional regulator
VLNSTVMNKSSGRGRRAGSPDTRAVIQGVATRRFLAEGYEAVTLRSIAADAGVDVALVSYYFGSKKGLFGAIMALPANPAEVFQQELPGDLETLAVRVLNRLLAIWDAPEIGPLMRTFAIAATSDPDLNRFAREVISREMVDQLSERLGGPRASQRAAAFSAQIAGVVFSRYLIKLEPIASMSAADVVRHLAPSLQLALRPAGLSGPARRSGPATPSARRTRPQ